MKGNKNEKTLATLFLLTCLGSSSAYADDALILQTDFSLKDGAVSAMKGVAFGVDHNLKIFDLTHEIPPYNIWEGAYRLYQTASYWPQGSVFVSVVDPGVGTDRKSVVLKTKNGQYFVSPITVRSLWWRNRWVLRASGKSMKNQPPERFRKVIYLPRS